MIESICAGAFFDKQPHEAYEYFDSLANKARKWALTRTQNFDGRSIQQGVGRYQLKEVDDVNDKLATMARKLEALEFKNVSLVGSEDPKGNYCAVCEIKDYDTMSCPIILGIKEALHGQTSAIGHYN